MAIDNLKDDTEIIFISGLNLYKTPKPLQAAMASKEASGPTPIVAIFDPMIENQIGVIPYFDMKKRNGFEKIKAALADYRGTEQTEDRMTMHAPETWQDTRGRSIQAAYVKSSASDVTVRLSSGKLSTIPLERLSEESQARVKELATQ